MLQSKKKQYSIYLFLRDHGVAVVTSALHAEVPRFDPGWCHSLLSLLIIYLAFTHNILNVAASKYQSFNIQLFKTPWCSGYHISLTRRRSPVRSRVVSLFSLLIINLPLNSRHIECCSVKKLIIQYNLFSRHHGVAVISSALHAEGPRFDPG